MLPVGELTFRARAAAGSSCTLLLKLLLLFVCTEPTVRLMSKLSLVSVVQSSQRLAVE